MRIEEVWATPVNIPLEAPYLWSVGVYPGISKVVIEVRTDEGLVGLGEAPSPECLPLIEQALAPRLAGCDPLDLVACARRCLPDTRVLANTDENTVQKAFGGIEVALWDLRGKMWNQPLYRLLGGQERREIAFSEYFAPRLRRGRVGGESTPQEIASYCARMRETHGCTIFEGNCLPGGPRPTIQLVKELRSALGADVELRLDANLAFSLHSAPRLLRGIEPYDVSNLEDPVPSYEEMARLRRHSSISFSSHAVHWQAAVRLGVPDAFVLNLSVLGGIAPTVRFVACCEAMGFDFWFYSGDTGIMTAAYLQVGAALEHIRQASQSLLRWQTDDVTEEGPFRPKNNRLPVPQGPGLGVHLSPSALRRCHRRFLGEGPYDPYQNPDSPGEYVRLPVC